METGYFDDEKREYVITTPVLPARWINYVGDVSFGGFVDHNGGLALCMGDAALNRITRYLAVLPASTINGETCYIRIHDSNGFRLFSPYYSPVLSSLDKWKCRVGLSYSCFEAQASGLSVSITVFVPREKPRLIRFYTIKNISENPVAADLVPVVEYSHFDSLKQITNRDWVPQTQGSALLEGPDSMRVLAQSAFMKKKTGLNFFTSFPGFSSFESRRDSFLGRYGYGTWQHPESLDLESLPDGQALFDENIGALLVKLGTIAPGETRTVITQLGQTKDMDTEWENIRFYNDPANVRKAIEGLSAYWDDYLDKVHVHTPDAAFDRVVNTLLPRQCHETVSWSRDLSLYQAGFGGRGTGFRDCAQDAMGICIHNPTLARALVEKLCMVQCCDGRAMHQFHLLSMEASTGDSREHPDRPSFYSDDHLWMVLAATAYVRETGDFRILDEVIPFYEKTNSGKPVESATVREHLSRALDFTARNLGAHGLPLAGFADWNDTMNLPTGSESVFTACLYGKALEEAALLADFEGDPAREQELRANREQMKVVVNTQAWDGAWYIAYFDAGGKPVGSAKNKYGKIFGHAQAWAVISGFADADRAKITMGSVDSLLATPWGTRLSFPGYDGYDPAIGGASTYPPGAKENGGIFCHAHAWMVIALAMIGEGDRAYDYFCRNNPALKNDGIELYEMEPYCYSQNILGTEHPKAGRARNSWLTGTAAWTYQAALRYILGIKPGYKTLEVDPNLPCSWESCSCTYNFRGCIISLEIRNPGHIRNGSCELQTGGKTIKQNTIPVTGKNSILSVQGKIVKKGEG